MRSVRRRCITHLRRKRQLKTGRTDVIFYKVYFKYTVQNAIRRTMPGLVGMLAICLFPPLMADEAKEEAKAEKAKEAAIAENLPKTVDEARSRARWMHELIRGSLQVMNRDFFLGR